MEKKAQEVTPKKKSPKALWIILGAVVLIAGVVAVLLCTSGGRKVKLYYPWGTSAATIAEKETILDQNEFMTNGSLRCDVASSKIDGIAEFTNIDNEVLFQFENEELTSFTYRVDPTNLKRMEQFDLMVQYYGENYHTLDIENMFFWLIGDTVVIYYMGEVTYYFADRCVWTEMLRYLQEQ